MGTLFDLRGVTYSYPWNGERVSVLRGINLVIQERAFVCFVGPSGSGKTTLLNLLGLLDRPDSGELQFDGQATKMITERESEILRLNKIGFIFQAFHLVPTLTVLENTSYFALQTLASEALAISKSREILAILGLQDHLHKLPGQLSGGQRQRVAIARALAKQPKVVLADEPTANLDAETATRTIETFKELQRSQNTSFLFSTHDPHLVSYASEVYHLHGGTLQKGGLR
jgi:putative ABC transport system ATP-binding protein/lipoprotein-releasing system ATP-binding protein